MTMSRGFAAGLSLALLALLLPACSTSTPTPAAVPASLDELAKQSLARLDGELNVPGLKEPVEIIRDQQGIPHIYAKNDDDMFFAQGYVMAQDRLWQLEMWRRWREGRLAEIFGPKAYDYDARTRLMMFRGPWDEKEWTSYHPDAERLFTAWANGLNAYVAQHADNLPVEFTLTGIKPEPWTARTVTLRWAAAGSRQRERHPARGDPPRARRGEDGREGGQQAGGAGPVGRPGGARRARREHHPGQPARRHPPGGRQPVRAGRAAAARDRAAVPRPCAAAEDRPRVARAPGHGRQQQLGGQRQALADGRADRLERPAPHHRDAVAALLRAPGVAGVERHRRRRAAVCRRGRRQQRPHGLGLHLRRHRHGRHLRRGDEPGRRRTRRSTRARGNRCGSSAKK